jgi:hypothetical protein
VASRMNCRYRAPVPFTLWSLPYSWRHNRLVRGDARKRRTRPFRRIPSGPDQRLDQHRFRPLGKLVVGNLDRIADIDDVGD